MKIIDILNKIANNEELPLIIKTKGNTYRLSNGQYWCDELEMYLIDDCTSVDNLNDEVEIIEENKKIEKITDVLDLECVDGKDRAVRHIVNDCVERINELIDEVNKLKENK